MEAELTAKTTEVADRTVGVGDRDLRNDADRRVGAASNRQRRKVYRTTASAEGDGTDGSGKGTERGID